MNAPIDQTALETLSVALDEFVAAPAYQESDKLFRRLSQLDADTRSGLLSRRLRIAFGGNCNTDFMRPGVVTALALEGFGVEAVDIDYDGWIGEALKGQPDIDWWVVWLSAMGASRGGTERRDLDIQGIGAAAQSIAARGENLLVILPEALPWEDDPFSPFSDWRTNLVSSIKEILPQPSSVVMSVEHIQRSLGMSDWNAPRYWTLAKCPCHPDAAAAVGVAVAASVALAVRPRIKAVVADLDNTLWGGVVGDDGPENVILDPDGEGRPFIEMQRFLKDLSLNGIPISVVSKNEVEQARRPFEEREEMILSLSDITHFRASWGHKYAAIKEIANDLNIGMDTICFIDDSVHERHEARSFLPDLIIPELTDDPDERVGDLIRSRIFSVPIKRDEDIKRVQMFREEEKRKQTLSEAVDYTSYLKSLGMSLEVLDVSNENLARVALLVQKTNQFNLTNLRMTSQQIVSLAQQANSYAVCCILRDRFGSSGIIGVILGEATTSHACIKEWVLSCRVFGRGVEDAMFGHFVAWAKDRDLNRIETDYHATERNKLVGDTLERLGFGEEKSNGQITQFSVTDPSQPEHFIAMET